MNINGNRWRCKVIWPMGGVRWAIRPPAACATDAGLGPTNPFCLLVALGGRQEQLDSEHSPHIPECHVCGAKIGGLCLAQKPPRSDDHGGCRADGSMRLPWVRPTRQIPQGLKV